MSTEPRERIPLTIYHNSLWDAGEWSIYTRTGDGRRALWGRTADTGVAVLIDIDDVLRIIGATEQPVSDDRPGDKPEDLAQWLTHLDDFTTTQIVELTKRVDALELTVSVLQRLAKQTQRPAEPSGSAS